jgi:tubulin-folding cofactor B
MTVDDVKAKVCAMTGSSAHAAELQLLDSTGRVIAPSLGGGNSGSDAGRRKLGYYGARSGWRLHVLDLDAASLAATGWLEDTSKVEKYVMSEADYEKREGTFRAYRRQRLAEDPNWTLEGEMRARRAAQAGAGGPGAAAAGAAAAGAGACCGAGGGNGSASAAAPPPSAEGIAVGARCSVAPGDRRGCVAYVGPAPELGPGDWVGVVYDEPVGKHDGAPKAGAARLFSCAPRHGGVARPDRVTVGDFPPAGLSDDEEDSDGLGSGDEI